MSIRVRVRRKPDRDTLQLWYKCPLTGRQITKSAETDNPRVAERKASEWEREVVGQVKVANPSWDEFVIRFEEEYLASKPKNTRASYMGALNNWGMIVGAVKSLDLITPSVVSKFAAEFAKSVKSTTVATNLRHIRAALRWAESMEMIRRAPRVVIPKQDKRRLARGRAITFAEFKLMRAAVPSVRPADETATWQRLLDVLWLSGLRIGEALELSWDEPPIMVDLDNGKYPRLIIFAEGQKSREDETAVITPEFAAWLRRTPARRREGLVVDLGECDRSSASHVISECGERAGIATSKTKHATAHDIRRAFGQRWAKIVRPLTLQKMMRHKSIATTLSFYVDLKDEDVGSELWGGASVPQVVPRFDSVESDAETNTRKNTGKNTRRRNAG